MDIVKKEMEARLDNAKECSTKAVTIKDLVEKYPNDADLGRRIRNLFKKIKNER